MSAEFADYAVNVGDFVRARVTLYNSGQARRALPVRGKGFSHLFEVIN
jgi:hypothetical protein